MKEVIDPRDRWKAGSADLGARLVQWLPSDVLVALNDRNGLGGEQFRKLGIRIEDEFSSIASRSSSPYDLGCRCTVFMDTELVNAMNQGVPVPDISAGLAYSITKKGRPGSVIPASKTLAILGWFIMARA